MTTQDLLRAVVERLAAAGIENPRLEARLLWQHAHESSLFPTEGGNDFDDLVARRIAREPLAYIIGRKEFWSLDFEVGPGVLVPRPETETLIEQALAAFADRAASLRVLDLGTGSGCLLIAALSLYPNAIGTGVDGSPNALAWARRNLIRHGFEHRATLVEGDWTVATGAFDLVFCNPPYVTTADIGGLAPELAWEPRRALEGGADGLEAYRGLGPVLTRLLASAGRAFVEIGARAGPSGRDGTPRARA